jgi:hypothetical protein
MATTTPRFGWPVPTSTDLVTNGATAIEALGDSIDSDFGSASYPNQIVNNTTGTARPIPFSMQAGNAQITPVANTVTGVAVTFASSRFTQTPVMVVTANSAATALRTATFSGASSTGVTINIFRTDTVSTGVNWVAIQMKQSSGDG